MIYGMQEAAGRERCLAGQICNVRQPYRGPPVTFPVDLQGSQLSRSVLMGVSVNSVVPTCSPYTSAERWHSSQASSICVNYSPGQAWKIFIYRAIFFFNTYKAVIWARPTESYFSFPDFLKIIFRKGKNFFFHV